ncbi:unnamed protein product, partial [Allacma fusca]
LVLALCAAAYAGYAQGGHGGYGHGHGGYGHGHGGHGGHGQGWRQYHGWASVTKPHTTTTSGSKRVVTDTTSGSPKVLTPTTSPPSTDMVTDTMVKELEISIKDFQ